MNTALDAKPGDLDEHERAFVEKIRKYGWAQTSVFADDEGPGFSFTTGFWREFGFPELIVFSLSSENANGIFENIYQILKCGEKPPVGVSIGEILENYDVILLPVSRGVFADFFGWNRWFYGGDSFSCLQLVWPEKNGRFPWDYGQDKIRNDYQIDLTAANWGGFSTR